MLSSQGENSAISCSIKTNRKESGASISSTDSEPSVSHAEPSASVGEPSVVPNANAQANVDANPADINDDNAESALLLNENEFKKIDIEKDEDKSNNPSLFNVGLPTIQGISRDLPWAFLTATEANWFKVLGPTWGPWFTQVGGSAGGLLVSSAGFFALNPRYRSRKGLAVIAMYASASLLAVIPWNYAQTLGADQGQNELGMSPEGASYFSALYTGLFEAVVQYAVISAVSAALDPQERSKWKFDFNHGAQRTVELLSFMPGGGMWQVVYQATYAWAKKNLQNALLTSSGVALSVATTSLLTANLAEKITTALDNYANKIKKKEENDIETQCHSDKEIEQDDIEDSDPKEVVFEERNVLYRSSI